MRKNLEIFCPWLQPLLTGAELTTILKTTNYRIYLYGPPPLIQHFEFTILFAL